MIILNHKKGFTLIELLLVVAIVTLLSSVFFYNSSEARKKAEDVHMAEESRQVSTAIQIYADDNNGIVPHNNTATAGRAYNETEPEYSEMLELLVTGGYISEIPTSPSRDSYYYGFSTDKKRGYIIYNSNKEGEKCKIIGEENPGDSCENILASIGGGDGGEVASCDLPPYVEGNSGQYEALSGEQAFDIYATDPEGQTVIFDLLYYEADPEGSNTCNMSGNTIYCNISTDSQTLVATFKYQTAGCTEEQQDSVQFINYDYVNPENY
jgi:prepilin-type N-terminal cleavage/methylation domain-containing protein